MNHACSGPGVAELDPSTKVLESVRRPPLSSKVAGLPPVPMFTSPLTWLVPPDWLKSPNLTVMEGVVKVPPPTVKLLVRISQFGKISPTTSVPALVCEPPRCWKLLNQERTVPETQSTPLYKT